MTLTDLVAPNAVIPALKVNSKKQAIQELATRAAELTGQNEKQFWRSCFSAKNSVRRLSATGWRSRMANCPS